MKRKPTCALGLAGVEGSEGGGSPDGSQTVSVWIVFDSSARRSGYFQRQHAIPDTYSLIRQVGDKSGCLASFHAELGLGAPGNAEPQLGACFQNGAKAT